MHIFDEVRIFVTSFGPLLNLKLNEIFYSNLSYNNRRSSLAQYHEETDVYKKHIKLETPASASESMKQESLDDHYSISIRPSAFLKFDRMVAKTQSRDRLKDSPHSFSCDSVDAYSITVPCTVLFLEPLHSVRSCTLFSLSLISLLPTTHIFGLFITGVEVGIIIQYSLHQVKVVGSFCIVQWSAARVTHNCLRNQSSRSRSYCRHLFLNNVVQVRLSENRNASNPGQCGDGS